MKIDNNTLKDIYEVVDNTPFNIDELGCKYTNEKSVFKVFAPTLSKLYLILDENRRFEMFNDNGTFVYEIYEDLERHIYHYETEESSFLDPFSFAQTKDRKNNYILNEYYFDSEKNVVSEEKETVIYEISVRDISSNLNNEFKKKIVFLSQDNLYVNDKSVGLNYLKDLGISHLQLMPIFDFDYDNNEYNWGYNPLSYSCIHPDFIYDFDDPYNQINELRRTVNILHKYNLKVTLDVVFNHVYDAFSHNLNKIIPYYFYRFNQDGYLANGSWCGNEIRTEGKFVRAYLTKMLERYIELFDIDGIRFDLMGLIDIETMNHFLNSCKKLKEDFILYGEPWNMGDVVPEEYRSSDLNLDKIRGIGAFNQFFRETIIEYIIDSKEDFDAIKDKLNASGALNFAGDQSINYVECHDGYTFYDRTFGFNKEDRVNKVKLALCLIAISRGISFYQCGQEFVRSKYRMRNTYNSSDRINRINWMRRKQYDYLVLYFKKLLKIKNEIKISKRDISEFSFDNYYEVIKYKIGEYMIFINACPFDHIYEDGNEYEIIFNQEGKYENVTKIVDIPKDSVIITKIK